MVFVGLHHLPKILRQKVETNHWDDSKMTLRCHQIWNDYKLSNILLKYLSISPSRVLSWHWKKLALTNVFHGGRWCFKYWICYIHYHYCCNLRFKLYVFSSSSQNFRNVFSKRPMLFLLATLFFKGLMKCGMTDARVVVDDHSENIRSHTHSRNHVQKLVICWVRVASHMLVIELLRWRELVVQWWVVLQQTGEFTPMIGSTTAIQEWVMYQFSTIYVISWRNR